jgi:curved DNA-binding protein CbpA
VNLFAVFCLIKKKIDRLDFYSILGVSQDASDNEIKHSFREMAKVYHPDINTSPDAGDAFRTLYIAYDTLTDPFKRRIYDRLLLDNDEPRQSLSWAYYEKMQRRAAMRARNYAAMQYEEFEDSAFMKVSFHLKQVIAFLLFFMLLCTGMGCFIIGANYIFKDTFNGAQVSGYACWMAGAALCYISGKALLNIYEIWRA